jgi:hypothetical protein
MMDRLPPFPSDPSSGLGGPAPLHELRASTRIGTEVAGFRIESVLGRGGMSVVYVAEQIRLARKVALKVLTNELAWDEQFRERFVRESHIAATIDHPNIIPIYDAGEADGLLYLPGHPRQELLRALRIPALSPGWQASFGAMLEGGSGSGNAGLAVTSPPPLWPAQPGAWPRPFYQASQDLGRHHFVYSLAGHAGDWQDKLKWAALGFTAAALDFIERQIIGPAAQIGGELAFGEGAELAAEGADVGVVDVAVDHIGDALAADGGA